MTRPPTGESISNESDNQRPIARVGLSNLAMKGELVEEIHVPEIDDELKSVYIKRPKGPILAGCSDERLIVPASAHQIKTKYNLHADGPIIRLYGAATGGARIVLITLAMRQPELVAKYASGGYETFTRDFAERAEEKAGVIFAVHSASANELHEHSLNLESHLGLGCAHAANTGLISYNAAHDETIKAVSTAEAVSLFGAEEANDIPLVAGANEAFIHQVLGGDNAYGADRVTFDRLGLPVMILGGDHLHADETEVVENYSIGQLADPRKAKAINRLHYTYDMTETAAVIIQSYPEIKFDPLDLFKVMHHDIVPTRGALTGGDPRKLKLSRYGDIGQAVDYLNSLSK